MLKRVLLLSITSLALLSGVVSAASLSISTGSGTAKKETGLVTFGAGSYYVYGGNNGSSTSSHLVAKQINYWPDQTISSFRLSESSTYLVPVSLSGGRYYGSVSGSSYSYTEMR